VPAVSPAAPDEVEAGYAAAERLMRIGATAEARAALLDLSARHDGDPRTEPALIDLARLASGAGQPEEARRLLQAYLRRYPQGTFAAQAEARLRELQ
jgi:outer membrane protein assembly factor BamD (BamD/ComL family)